MNNNIINLLLVQFKEMYREPAILFWAFVFPAAMAAILGVAFNNPQDPVRRVAVISPRTAETILPPTVNKGFKFTFMERRRALSNLRKGKVSLLLEINAQGYRYHFDRNNSESELTYLYLKDRLQSGAISAGISRKHEVAVLSAVGNRYIDFLVPGLVALGIMNSCIWGIGWGLMELRMKKLLRRMAASPMKKWHFLFAHFFGRLVMGTAESAVLMGICMYFFDIHISGSLPAFALTFIAGIIAFTGMAVLISCRVDNSRVANGLINAATLPMMIFSGIFFSYHNFPEFVIPIIQLLPLTVLADTLRNIMIEGWEIRDIVKPVAVLTLSGAAFFGVGLKFYRWH